MQHISINKNEYNVRRVEELNVLILEKEKALKNVKGFIESFKLKRELKKLYKEISIHGSETLEFDKIKSLHNNY